MALVICVGAKVLCGCSKENGSSDRPIPVSLQGQGACIADFKPTVSAFVKADLSEKEIHAFWQCLDKAVEDFQRLTTGENGGSTYTRQAVRRFLVRYFLTNHSIDESQVRTWMRVKRIFLAGDEETITRAELTRLRELLSLLESITMRLNPHIQVIWQSKPEWSEAQLGQAQAALAQVINEVGQWLTARGQPLSVGHLHEILVSIEGDWAKWTPILAAGKRVFLGGSPDEISAREWFPLGQLFAHGAGAMLQFRQAFSDDLNKGLKGRGLPAGLRSVGEILSLAIHHHADQTLPLSEVEELVRAFSRSGLLPQDFTEQAMQNATHLVLTRLLGQPTSSVSMGAREIRFLEDVTNNWFEVLGAADLKSEDPGRLGLEFKAVLGRSSPMTWDEEGRLIQAHSSISDWRPDSARRLAWPFAVLNWVRRAYVGDALIFSEEDLHGAVGEILPVLQGFGWLKTTKLTIGKRLLREADLFTLVSNGDFNLDLGEAAHYLAFVTSGYRSARVWLTESEGRCVEREARCVRGLAVRAGSSILDPLPRLKQTFGARPERDFARYMIKAEETILGKMRSGPMATSDLVQVWQLFQYVEVFLAQYDVSGDQTIELDESFPAFDKFGPTLGKLISSSGLPRDELLALFTFMMKYGDTPFSLFGGQVLYLHWKWHRNDWEFHSNRETLMSILNQLSKL